jgi:hypothetical protein
MIIPVGKTAVVKSSIMMTAWGEPLIVFVHHSSPGHFLVLDDEGLHVTEMNEHAEWGDSYYELLG